MLKFTRNCPAIKDIDMLADVITHLSDIYKSAHVDHWGESKDIFNVLSFSDYVKAKKSSGFSGAFKYAIRSGFKLQKFGYILSKEDEVQIRSFVTDVSLQTDKIIQSFNISKMGYNKSCIHQLTDYIKAR